MRNRLPATPSAIWPFRRSMAVRTALRIGALACLVALGTGGPVHRRCSSTPWATRWACRSSARCSPLGPLVGLLVCLGVRRRAAVAAGPGWVGVRFLRRWRVLDLSDVRVVRVSAPRPFAGPLGVPSGEPQLLLEDAEGHHLEIGAGALAPGIAEAVIEGLGPEVAIDPDAAAMLERAEDHGPDVGH